MNDPGFWIIERLLTDEECDRILKVILQNLKGRTKAGIRNLMAVSEISELANDEHVLLLTERISGKRLIPFKATLFEKTGKANWLVSWHQDTTLPLEKSTQGDGWGPVSVKQGVTFVHAPTWVLKKILALRIQLDASTKDNGPLRVIPGSHLKRLKKDAEFEQTLASRDEVVCTTGRGGVIAMSPLIIHASSKAINNEPRRVLHIEYAESLNLAPGIRLAIA
ncbi:MAG: phytanoyl-CoA dioxygenase family protein [Blastocatellia bacterium]